MIGKIDGAEIYLSESQLPAVSLSIDSILDPAKAKGATSTTFRIIASKEVRRKLGTEHIDGAFTNRRLELRIGNEGDEVFTANVLPVRADRDEVECIGVGGNASWFEWAKRTNMRRDIEWGYGQEVTQANVENSWSLYEERLDYWPMVDFGDHTDADDSSDEYWLEDFRPGLQLWRALVQAFESNGFTLVAAGKRAPQELPHLIHMEDSSKALTRNKILNLEQFDPVGTGPTFQYAYAHDDGTPVAMPFDVVFNPDGLWTGFPSFSYTADKDGTITVEFVASLYCDTSAYDNKRFRVVLFDNDDGIILGFFNGPKILPGDATSDFSGTFSAFVPDGHEVYLGVTINATIAGTVTLPNNTMGADVFQEGPIKTFGGPLVLSSIMPTVPVSDVLRDLLKARSMVVTTQGSRVSVWAYEDYFRAYATGAEYRDWSGRMDHTVAPAKLRDSLPSQMDFRYAEDAEDYNLNRMRVITGGRYANGDTQIEAGYMPTSEITLRWAPTFMASRFDGCIIPIIRRRGEDGATFEHQPRLLYADGEAAGNWTFKFGAFTLPSTVYPKCYFLRPSFEEQEPMAFGTPYILGGQQPTVLDGPWSRRIEVMRTSRILEAYLFIRDHELKDFDHGMPTLVDDGSGPTWFWVQEIKQHRFGVNQPTKCVLVQIPMKEVAIPEVDQPNLTYPSQPFLCSGPGYVSFVVGSGGGGGVNMSTASGFYTVRYPNGTRSVVDSNVETLDLGPGSYCMWPSDSEGNIEVGTTTFLGLGGGINEVDMDGMSSEPLVDLLVIDTTELAALEIPSIPTLYYVTIQGNPALELLTFANAGAMFSVLLENNNLSQTSVDGILSVLAAGTVSGGVIDIAGGTNAAPGATGLAAIAVLAGTTMGIADTGNANVDGDYDPNGTLNGRDAYIHATNGVTEVYWTGSVWRIVAVGAILDSSDDVAQPWLATTWTLISGTASDPTITAPGRGWTVTTN